MSQCPPHGPLSERLERGLASLREILRSLKGALVAFSGGVDSSLMARAAFDALAERAVAATIRSAVHFQREFEQARGITRLIGIRHITINADLLAIEAFAANPPDRCYHCKRHVFETLLRRAADMGIPHVVDGANADDSSGFRPGARAARELGVRSPIAEAGLTKADVRGLSRSLGLPTWDRPSQSCLATRVPYGERLTEQKLHRIALAEGFLRHMGFAELRVRSHGDIARIEVPLQQVSTLASPETRRLVAARLRELGYAYVTIDIEGLRSGSMDEPLTDTEVASHGSANE